MISGARRVRLAMAALSVVLGTGCITVHRPWFMEPTVDREWENTLLMARVRASEGKFDAADSVLARFATRFSGTPEAVETSYWRALFRLDPANHDASFAMAMTSLDLYLADPHPRKHSAEAATLRRIAGHMHELNKLAATALAEAKDTSTAAKVVVTEARPEPKPAAEPALPNPADAEIKRLKDELAKANAELERIRRRLAQPPPSKP